MYIPKKLASDFKTIVDEVLDHFINNQITQFTEEHILTIALNRLDNIYDLRNDAKRIWSTRQHQNIDGEEYNLKAWHMPSDKDYGFNAAFNIFQNASFSKKELSMSHIEKQFSVNKYPLVNLIKKTKHSIYKLL